LKQRAMIGLVTVCCLVAMVSESQSTGNPFQALQEQINTIVQQLANASNQQAQIDALSAAVDAQAQLITTLQEVVESLQAQIDALPSGGSGGLAPEIRTQRVQVTVPAGQFFPVSQQCPAGWLPIDGGIDHGVNGLYEAANYNSNSAGLLGPLDPSSSTDRTYTTVIRSTLASNSVTFHTIACMHME